jgi:hypothetical protein
LSGSGWHRRHSRLKNYLSSFLLAARIICLSHQSDAATVIVIKDPIDE